jgi:uncharacterized protein (DUF4415 family)
MSKPYSKELAPEDLAKLTDAQIDTSDIPELDDAFWGRSHVVEPEGTEQITLRVKKSVLKAFRDTGKGYQTRMNAVLETYTRAMKK